MAVVVELPFNSSLFAAASARTEPKTAPVLELNVPEAFTNEANVLGIGNVNSTWTGPVAVGSISKNPLTVMILPILDKLHGYATVADTFVMAEIVGV